MPGDLAGWLVFVHVLSAFAFAASHGVSLYAAFRIRRERDPNRLAALLDLSAFSLYGVLVSVLVLLGSGFAAGWLLGSFGRGWFWTSVVLLVVIGGLMTPLGGMYYNRIRQALGQRQGLKKDQPDPVPLPPAELERLLETRRPEWLLLVGGGGFVVILWLMMFRPF
jgi:hypothetical protein